LEKPSKKTAVIPAINQQILARYIARLLAGQKGGCSPEIRRHCFFELNVLNLFEIPFFYFIELTCGSKIGYKTGR
jgi:hypothetical protein